MRPERALNGEPSKTQAVDASAERAASPVRASDCARALLALAAGLTGLACGSAPEPPAGPPPAYERPEYTRLSETGLFAAAGAQALAQNVSAYTPNYALWSDGADKSRWISMPEGGWIDTSDMNH